MRELVWIVAMIVGGVGGCAAYNPGTFEHPGRRFPGQRLTVGCLDISVDRRADMTDGAAVLDYQFGNRCDDPVLVDLVRVPVYGRTAMEDEVSLAAYDPALEMMAMKLDARQAGGEAIAYRSNEPAGAFAQICVDAAAINADAKESRWLCFGSAQPATPAPATTPPPTTPPTTAAVPPTPTTIAEVPPATKTAEVTP